MDLDKIFREMERVKRSLADSRREQEKITEQSAKLYESFRESQSEVSKIHRMFHNLIPTEVQGNLVEISKIQDSILKSKSAQAALESEIMSASAERLKILDLELNARKKLSDILGSMIARGRTNAIEEYEELKALRDSYEKAVKDGKTELASARFDQLSVAVRGSSKEVKKAYAAYSEFFAALSGKDSNADKLEKLKDKSFAMSKEVDKATRKMRALTKENKSAGFEQEKFAAAVGKFDGKIPHLVSGLETYSLLLGKIWKPVGWIAAATGVAGLIRQYRDALDLLKQIDSSISNQASAIRTTNSVVMMTGLQYKDVLQAQKALAVAGLKKQVLDRETVKTASLLAETIEVSVEDASQLALYSKLVGTNYAKAGDEAARLVDKTALVGREAINVSLFLTKAARELSAAVKSLDSAQGVVGAFAGRVKELGGSSESVLAVLERFKSLEGIGDSALFGGFEGFVLDPSAIGDAQKLEKILGSVSSTISSLTAGGKDPLLLQAYAPMFQRLGLTLAQAQAFAAVSNDPQALKSKIKELNEARRAEESLSRLQVRYNNQLAITATSLEGLWRRLKAFGGLLVGPLLTGIAHVANGLGRILDFFLEMADSFDKAFLPITSVISTIASVGASLAVGGVLLSAATAAGVLTVALTRMTGAMLAASARAVLGPGAAAIGGRLAGGATALGAGTARAAATVLRFLPLIGSRILPLLGPIGIMAGTLASIYLIFKWWNKRQERKEAEDRVTKARLEADRIRDRYRDVRTRLYQEQGLSDDDRKNSNFYRKYGEKTPVSVRPAIVNFPKNSVADIDALRERESVAALKVLTNEVVRLRASTESGSAKTNETTKRSRELDRSEDRLDALHKAALAK